MKMLTSMLSSHVPARRLIDLPPSIGDVTTYDFDAEVDPRDLGLDRDKVRRVWSAIESLYARRVQPAVSLVVRREGRIVLKRSIGHARGAPPLSPADEEPRLVRPETPFCLFSASKAITAMVIHLLDERGLLHIDDPVAEYIPEFARRGKEAVTIRHVLTHRAGLPSLPYEQVRPEMLLDWEGIVRLLCEARLVSTPGRQLAYHAVTGGYILGEVARRVTGSDLGRLFEESFARPLGLDRMRYGWPVDRAPEVARNYATGLPPLFPLSRLVRRALGVWFEEAVEISNDPRFLAALIPAANVFATADDVSRFYELLLAGGSLGGVRVLHPRTVRRALNESSYLEFDFTLGFPVRYGLGMMLGARHISLFGPDSPRAFGHLGFLNILTWADPERRLSVALLTSGKPFVGAHLLDLYAFLRAVAAAFPKVAAG